MTAHVEFLGDGKKAFKLTPILMEELQRKAGTPIGTLCQRVFRRDFTTIDLTETIRLGLIGGGTDPEEAAALVETYVRPRTLNENWLLATSILKLAYFGPEQESDSE
jgi:hypothetical protein